MASTGWDFLPLTEVGSLMPHSCSQRNISIQANGKISQSKIAENDSFATVLLLYLKDVNINNHK